MRKNIAKSCSSRLSRHWEWDLQEARHGSIATPSTTTSQVPSAMMSARATRVAWVANQQKLACDPRLLAPLLQQAQHLVGLATTAIRTASSTQARALAEDQTALRPKLRHLLKKCVNLL